MAFFVRSNTSISSGACSVAGYDPVTNYFPLVYRTSSNALAADLDVWAVNEFRGMNALLFALFLS